MNRNRQQKFGKYGGRDFWAEKPQFLLEGGVRACASEIFKSKSQSIFFLSSKCGLEFFATSFWFFCLGRLILRPEFIYLVNPMPECIS